MQNKDFVGARKIAIKDEQLYLDLEIISKMLTVCKIHYSTKHKLIGNDIDWHGILQIEQMTEGISKTTTQQNGLVSLPKAPVVKTAWAEEPAIRLLSLMTFNVSSISAPETVDASTDRESL